MDEDLRQRELDRLTAFVLRARRVEEHSLLHDSQFVVDVSHGTFKATLSGPDRKLEAVRQVLPTDEEQLESATARVRPLVLNDDPANGLNAVNALGTLLLDRSDDDRQLVEPARKSLRDDWKNYDAKPRPDGSQDGGYMVMIDGNSASSHDLGWAWIYGDVVHADEARRAATAMFGVTERYRAGAVLVCQIMVTTIATLNLVRQLVDRGWIELPDGTMSEQVVITPDTIEHLLRGEET